MKLFFSVSILLFSIIGSATPFNGYIVKLKNNSNIQIQKLNFSQYGNVKKLVSTSFGVFAHLDTKQDLPASAIQKIAQSPAVEYIEPNYIIKLRQNKNNSTRRVLPLLSYYKNPSTAFHNKLHTREIEFPQDSEFSRQWGLYNDGSEQEEAYSSVEGEDLNILKAWEITKGSKTEPIKIAVIDTGIDYRHSDLKDQMDVNIEELNGKTGVDDDGNGFIDDIYGYDFANNDGDPMDGGGHGTHCAGVIGASHNDIGIAGVMANVKLVALKFLTDEGEGEEINAVQAIDYAIKRGVKVLSNSWGGTDRVQALEDAIVAANKAGLSFVAAAGNDSADNDTTDSFPSNFNVENMIAVGSFNATGVKSGFSNFGIKSVHIMAPGSEILSTYKDENYEVLSGTSMATPHVAGVIGLLLTQWPDLTPAQIRSHLIATSYKTDALSKSSVSGGRVDAYSALITKPE
jgi:subtilisin family serine protease